MYVFVCNPRIEGNFAQIKNLLTMTTTLGTSECLLQRLKNFFHISPSPSVCVRVCVCVCVWGGGGSVLSGRGV